ncbi:YkvA family protein [Pseudoneobacillus sp. C159]
MLKERFKNGHLRFTEAAKDYVESPEKTKELIQSAGKKAANNKNSLQDVWDRLHLLFDFVTDWRNGEYRKVPNGSVLMIVATIIYFVSPIDMVPDFLIGLGILDDAAVIGFTLKQIGTDLDKYKEWKEDKSKRDPSK